MRLRMAVVALAGLVAGTAASRAATLEDPRLVIDLYVAGLVLPTGFEFIGPDDMLVIQKENGQVRRVIGGVLQGGNVLDLPVNFASERGLLGIARDPDFDFGGPGGGPNDYIYLYYTRSSTGFDTESTGAVDGNRIVRYLWDGSALVNPEELLVLPATPGPNHDGGVILFGPDGKLYAVIGDLNRNGKLENFPSGADPDNTASILRMNRDGTVPADNPFVGFMGMDYIFAYGVRNSFGMTFDPFTGRLWDTENGPNVYDEINLVEAGFNSGWEQIMGPDSRDPQDVSDLWMDPPGAFYSDPEFSWLQPVGVAAITTLCGGGMPADIAGHFVVGEANFSRLFKFRPNATRDALEFDDPALQDLVADNNTTELAEVIWGTAWGIVTDMEIGPDRALYVCSLFSGRIFRVTSTVPYGDFNSDGSVDIVDFSTFSACFGGSGVPVDPGCEGVDADCDNDVDIADFSEFANNFGQ